ARLFGHRPNQTMLRRAAQLIPSDQSNTFRRLLAATCLLLLLAESISAQASLTANHSVRRPSSAGVTRLAVGHIVEKALASGEQQTYWLKLAPGQFIAVQLEQQGVDVALTLCNTNQEPVAAANYTSSLRGTEQLV